MSDLTCEGFTPCITVWYGVRGRLVEAELHMGVRNILRCCPKLTVFWLYIDRSNVPSWNVACFLLQIIILWALICTDILGTEFLYQLTSVPFKNRHMYVPPIIIASQLQVSNSVACLHPESALTVLCSKFTDLKPVPVLRWCLSIEMTSITKILSVCCRKHAGISLLFWAGPGLGTVTATVLISPALSLRHSKRSYKTKQFSSIFDSFNLWTYPCFPNFPCSLQVFFIC